MLPELVKWLKNASDVKMVTILFSKCAALEFSDDRCCFDCSRKTHRNMLCKVILPVGNLLIYLSDRK